MKPPLVLSTPSLPTLAHPDTAEWGSKNVQKFEKKNFCDPFLLTFFCVPQGLDVRHSGLELTFTAKIPVPSVGNALNVSVEQNVRNSKIYRF